MKNLRRDLDIEDLDVEKTKREEVEQSVNQKARLRSDDRDATDRGDVVGKWVARRTQ